MSTSNDSYIPHCRRRGSSITVVTRRMDDARNTEKIIKINLHQKPCKRRLTARGKDDVANDIREMRIVNWRKGAQDGDGWRAATREALILFG